MLAGLAMEDQAARTVARIGAQKSVGAEVHLLRQDFIAHAALDKTEFAALRTEHRAAIGELKKTQDSVATNQQTIMHALGLSAAHERRKRKRPIFMMGQWEGLLKLGSAFGGLMLMLKLVEAAAPGIGHSLLELWHAVLAMNHVAVG